MADFQSNIYTITVKDHPDADKLELACVGDYNCIIQKDSMVTGDLAAYIPEASIVPDKIISDLGLEGRLSGKKKNRVKAIRLRGIVSQGLVYPVGKDGTLLGKKVSLGEDVTELLGLKKHEPPLPVHMKGDVEEIMGLALPFDIENVKKYPHILEEGDEVVFTEKLHGTWCSLGLHDKAPNYFSTSKGMMKRGLIFKETESNLKKNVYVRTLKGHTEQLDRIKERMNHPSCFYILGEIFGRGIQDLHYGKMNPDFAVFDLYTGYPPKGRYLSWDELQEAISGIFESVPLVYRGPYSKEKLLAHTGGKSLLGNHVREGVVVRPAETKTHPEIGRVLLKSVSEEYLFRKGNTTDYA